MSFTPAGIPFVDVAAERRLARFQAVAGLLFASFLCLHLLNTAAAALGTGAYDALQRALRWYYQLPPVELLCVALAAAAHLGAGIARLRRRRATSRALAAAGRPPLPVPLWLRAHRLSGWFLALIFLGHVAATRGPSLLLGTPVDSRYLGFSLATWPWFMFPYYVALYTTGLYHLLFGSSLALRALGPSPPIAFGVRERTSARICAGAALAAGVLGVLALGGLLHRPVDGSRDAEWRALFEEWAPFMVNWNE